MIRSEEEASLYLDRRDAKVTPPLETDIIYFGIKETDLRIHKHLFWNQREGFRLVQYLFRHQVDRDRIRKHVFQEMNHQYRQNPRD